MDITRMKGPPGKTITKKCLLAPDPDAQHFLLQYPDGSQRASHGQYLQTIFNIVLE